MRFVSRHVLWLALVLLLLSVGARVMIEGRRELARGEEALNAGRRAQAQQHFLAAARWYLPLLGTTDEGVEALLQLGQEYLDEENYQAAVAAYDDARGALYSVTWLAGPDEELLAQADAGYATALAHWKQSRDASVDLEAAEERYREAAASPRLPATWWSLLMGLSFLGYLGCLGYLAWRWDDRQLNRWPWVTGAAAGFVVWIIALFLI